MARRRLYDTDEWRELFIDACNNNSTMLSASVALGIPYISFKRYAIKYGCWKPNQNRIGIPRNASEYENVSVPLHEILEGKHPSYHYGTLKRRLLRAAILKNECDECHITEWNGKKLNMHMDHIDGNPRNHKRDNLRMLCPNCHAQTDTYSKKNKNINIFSEEELKTAIESSTTYEESYSKLGVLNHIGSVIKLKNQIHDSSYKLKNK